MTQAAILITFLAYMFFALKRGMTYLHLFQQDEYDASRFLRWITLNGVFDRRLTGILVVVTLVWFFLPADWGVIGLALVFVCFAGAAVIEKDPRKTAKKKLAMTARARRIMFIYLGLMALMGLWWFVLPLPWIWMLNVQFLPFILLVANLSLQPFESFNQKKFWNEAHEKLLTLNPIVIGVTGSFGKTSVKHILGHILKTYAPTLITPGSVNTPMGVTRIIREQLEERHKFFVVEMGAYGPGSVKRLCELAPPKLGIITAIGHAHYERFKSLDVVAEAKFELVEAALHNGGKAVIHENCLPFPYAKKLADENPTKFIICGPNSEVKIGDVRQTKEGTEVSMMWNNMPHVLQIPLHGKHHGHNAALAFAASVALGVAPENAVLALRTVPQITHRLEVKPQADGTIIIDDAFNSNPAGFTAALETLNVLGGRRILITPGMAELGEAHAEEHAKLGALAAKYCDIAVIVMPERIPTFIDAYKTAGGKELIEVGSFSEASAWLDKNRKSGDVILLENDLPDIYEAVPNI